MRTTRIAICTGLLISWLTSPALLNAQTTPSAKPDAKPPKVTLASLAAQVATLTQQLQAVQSQLASANAQNAFALGQFITVDTQHQINGVLPPHIIVTGANLHVRSGSGTTIDDTHLGNLLIGYDSDTGMPPIEGAEAGCSATPAELHLQRGGSHNLIIGDCHLFNSSGGFVAGFNNHILGDSASVGGGDGNEASGSASSVSGGFANGAIGEFSSVSGGLSNQAIGVDSSVSGGAFNEANGKDSSVSGGISNQANGEESSVTGGVTNQAKGLNSSVSGGRQNDADGQASSIGGGLNQTENSDNTNIN